MLEEIAGLRGLDDQAALLQEAEAELADLDGRLKEAQSGRARAEARCRELTSEVERVSAAGEALETLESLVRRSRNAPKRVSASAAVITRLLGSNY